jgi:hypothetical protein
VSGQYEGRDETCPVSTGGGNLCMHGRAGDLRAGAGARQPAPEPPAARQRSAGPRQPDRQRLHQHARVRRREPREQPGRGKDVSA